MKGVAVSILILALCVSDAGYTHRFGVDHPCAKLMGGALGVLLAIFLIIMMVER